MKGFTLAELLGVLVILAVIALITFPIVNNSIKNSKEKLYNSQLEEIKNSAEKWAYSNINMLPTDENTTVTVTLLELKKSGFVPIDTRNPKTGELLPNDMIITITLKNNNYDIFVDGESGTDISNDYNENAPSIVLNGYVLEYVEINGSYNELGAVAKDKSGNSVSVEITYQENGVEKGSIDTSKFTTYTVIYSATSNGYTSRVTRTVIIRDTTPPNLIVPDNIELTEEQLASFNLLAGVSVTDNSGETIEIETRGFDRLPTDKVIEYKACDNHNNCVTKRRLVKIIELVPYKDNSGANIPELLNNMVPIKYDGTNWIMASRAEKWYDYDSKEWANAIVLNKNKNVGDIVNEEDIDLWYVWIPRYKYKLFNANNGSVSPQEIELEFEKDIETTGTVSCVDKVSGSGSVSETCTNATNGNWYTHPAFTFGSQELTGFWVAKFEVSGNTDKITIKPNITSLRSTTVSSFFTAIQKISSIYEIYNSDSHMIKNMEWGAVAYFKQSKYGLGLIDIGINNNSGYITGCGASVGSEETSQCNEYNTSNGILASTTGNIYGVYDMSGGAWEYVMGNMVNSSGNFYINSSGFTNVLDSKYYDKYTYNATLTVHGRGKLGDATKETLKTFGNINGGWNNDYATFAHSDTSWFQRGGSNVFTVNSGIFAFDDANGTGYTGQSTRSVLVTR